MKIKIMEGKMYKWLGLLAIMMVLIPQQVNASTRTVRPLSPAMDLSVDFIVGETILDTGKRILDVTLVKNARTLPEVEYEVFISLNGLRINHVATRLDTSDGFTDHGSNVEIGGPIYWTQQEFDNKKNFKQIVMFDNNPHNRYTPYEVFVYRTGYTATIQVPVVVPSSVSSNSVTPDVFKYHTPIYYPWMGSRVVSTTTPEVAIRVDMFRQYGAPSILAYAAHLTLGCTSLTQVQPYSAHLFVRGSYYGTALPEPWTEEQLQRCEDRVASFTPDSGRLEAGTLPALYSGTELEFVLCYPGSDDDQCVK